MFELKFFVHVHKILLAKCGSGSVARESSVLELSEQVLCRSEGSLEFQKIREEGWWLAVAKRDQLSAVTVLAESDNL